MKTIIAIVAAAGSMASANITINEVLGSTAGADSEFIELYNTGASAVDLTGWSIELWDSDAGTAFGTSDGAAPYVINTGSIAAGGWFLMSNALADATYGVTGDFLLPSNAIENSSYTMVLRDAGANVMQTIFVTDGGAGDAANIAGTIITPDATFGPDGTFLPAGFYRVGDGSDTLAVLEFDQPSPSATPGYANIPAPAALGVLGLGGLVAARRRR
ncbi:MAG: lamin tail domain-containing protein [Phycisphaeraceae bacterium]|nr:MAG: lamin tail domain-containing protein [Phycisphaeraceae bacterium]